MNQSCEKVLRYLTGSESIGAVSIDGLQKLANENPSFQVAQFLLAKKLKAENSSSFLPQVQKTALYFFNPHWLYYQLMNDHSQELKLKQDEFIRVNDISAKKTLNTEAETTEVLEEMAGAKHEINNTAKAFLNESALPLEYTNHENKDIESAELDEHEQMFQNIKAMLDATSEEADADTRNTVVPIDPYYTIDYFASQGIKLELDQNPKDQLGKNLKKFTQWLKHMKKLGPEDAAESFDRTETEVDIQQIADRSNTAREVVTEAMALVLEKQGKKEKAIELYNKLSFLNRDKSAYFATKIKNLKGL